MPTFDNPPQIEVALAVQFKRLAGLQTPHFGLFWNEIRGRFPTTMDLPPLDPVFEPLGSGFQGVNVEVFTAPPLPRCSFRSQSGAELLQLQQDRFVLNWLQTEPGDEYPRYSTVRRRFTEEVAGLAHFVREHLGEELVPNQCEVTYVNLITREMGWDPDQGLRGVLSLWSQESGKSQLPPIEDSHLKLRFRMTDQENNPIGRLHVEVTTVARPGDPRKLTRMSLTARGNPLGAGLEGVFQFLDIGHDCVVSNFASLTRAEMHSIWKRTS